MIATSAIRLLMSFVIGGIDPSRQKSDLCQPSTGKRSRQQFKAASVAFNNETCRHQIEQKVVDRMCERIRPWFQLSKARASSIAAGQSSASISASSLSRICKRPHSPQATLSRIGRRW
ncbi:hypothetical protein [Mesorhizobium sp.]|uniref:hypothetical protein n=1 Tax=Mesorhizobium sp. TaxID=1871066 RepID=UPI000FE59CEE|nr:hypothetical protein [Mesorhizobium sp.]RWQ13610.1 MAG: hypothetical protein EOR93_31360 [Mesorhizobium sp.]TIN73534.1 MAG: hypothetical protein E5Y30_01760 [Mesorhizobium sp.]